jgi:hypothetical protein
MNIQITFTAAIGELVNGMKTASQKVADTAKQMTDSMKTVGIESQRMVNNYGSIDKATAQSAAAHQGLFASMANYARSGDAANATSTAHVGLMNSMAGSTKIVSGVVAETGSRFTALGGVISQSLAGMGGSLGTLGSAISALGPGALVIGGIGLAVMALKKALDYVAESSEAVYQLSDVFRDLKYATGASTAQLNAYTAAMEMSGGKMGDVERLLMGMARAIRTNADKLIENGVAANKAALMAMPFEEYLARVSKLTDEMATPNEKMLMLQLAFGRGAALSGDQLKDFNENLKEGTRLTKENGIVTEKSLTQQDETEKSKGRLIVAQQKYAAVVSDTATPILNWWRELRISVLETQTPAQDLYATLSAILALNPAAMIAKFGTALGTTKPDTGFGAMTPGRERDVTVRHMADPEAKKDLADAAARAKTAAEKRKSENQKLWDEEAAQSKHMLEMEIKEEDKAAKAGGEIQKEAGRESMAVITDEYAWKRMVVSKDLAAGMITKSQELAAMRALYGEEQALLVKQLEAERDAAEEGSLERIKAENKVLDAKRKAAIELQRLDVAEEKTGGKAGFMAGIKDYLAASKTSFATWKALAQQAASGVQASFATAFKGILSGQMTATQGMRALWDGLKNTVVDIISQMLAKWIAAKIFELVFGKTIAAQETTAGASTYAVNAMASVAAIPVTGWAMAPAVGAAAFALGMSYAGIGMAAGGYRVPTGLNPITQLHSGEHVIPASIAKNYEAGAPGRGGGGLTVNVNAMDSKSIEQHFRAHAPRYAAMMRGQARMGNLGRRV